MLKFGWLFDLAKRLEHTKVSVYGVRLGASSPHIKFWHTLSISGTNRARKFKFGKLVGICRYYTGTASISPKLIKLAS